MYNIKGLVFSKFCIPSTFFGGPMKSFLSGAIGQVLLYGGVTFGGTLLFALVTLSGLLPGNALAVKTSVGAGLIMGPIVVVGILATINRGKVMALIAKTIAFLATGTVIVLARFQAETMFGEGLGGELCLFSTFLLFSLVGLTSLFTVINGVVYGSSNGGKEFWQRRNVPFELAFILPGCLLAFPLVTLILFEAVGKQPAVLGRFEDMFGQLTTYWLVISLNVAGLAGATLLMIAVGSRLYYRPWFQLGKGDGEASLITTLWVFFIGVKSTTFLVGSYLLVQKAGMNLWVQQVGSDTTPFNLGLGFTAAILLVTSLVAWWKVRTYVLEP